MTEPQTVTEPMPEWARKLFGDPDTPTPATPRDPFSTPGRSSGTSPVRYALAAVEAECERVANAPQGTRNHALNRAAFSLGQLVAAGALDHTTTELALQQAARQAGLTGSEITATIASGLGSGAETPRAIPERPNGPNTTVERPDTEPSDGTDENSDIVAYLNEHMPPLDWHALWADDTEEEWILEPLLPARRLVALYSAPKVGKSLLMLEVAAAIATGRDILGTTPTRRHVLYVDFENDPRADIRQRLRDMGYGPDDLDWLHYLSFPSLRALDSEPGSRELLAAVHHHHADVVFIDTVSRAVAGEENENDTWLSFYRHTGLKLKQAGVAALRLDHSGKDETKGQRGGSAKVGDVDAVWRMARITDTKFQIVCEAHRMQLTETRIVLDRKLDPLRHDIDTGGAGSARAARIAEIVDHLEAIDAPRENGREATRALLNTAGLKLPNDYWPDVRAARQPPWWQTELDPDT